MYPGGMRIDHEEEQAVLQVLRTRPLFRYYGPQEGPSAVAELESRFAEHCGVAHALAVSSGTAALVCGLVGLGVGPGDEVIVPAYTFISTAAAVLAAGAVPVLAEVDDSLTLDVADVQAKITDRTTAIIPVHMRGAAADMDPINRVARQRGVAVLEDAAQANGGSYRGAPLGAIGSAGAFSLQFNKIITSGEGGLLVTDDDQAFERMLMYHDVNSALRKHIPEESRVLGVNLRLSELQGAVALVQLTKLDPLVADMRRRKSAIKEAVTDSVAAAGAQFRRLNSEHGDAGVALVFFMPDQESAARTVTALGAEGVPTARMFTPDRVDNHVYYHWTSLLAKRTWGRTGPWDWHGGDLSYRQDMCPRTLDLLGRAVHIDISPDLTDRHVEQYILAIRKVLERSGG